MNDKEPDQDLPYELEEVILILESIKEHGSGSMNPWKALLCLAKEIRELKDKTAGISRIGNELKFSGIKIESK
jgi:hypothetical protein